MQIMETKDSAVRDSHFEEAAVLRHWELDLKAQLVGPACDAAPIALVDTPEIEAVRCCPYTLTRWQEALLCKRDRYDAHAAVRFDSMRNRKLACA